VSQPMSKHSPLEWRDSRFLPLPLGCLIATTASLISNSSMWKGLGSEDKLGKCTALRVDKACDAPCGTEGSCCESSYDNIKNTG
jgi:hypothetical protein